MFILDVILWIVDGWVLLLKRIPDSLVCDLCKLKEPYHIELKKQSSYSIQKKCIENVQLNINKKVKSFLESQRWFDR